MKAILIVTVLILALVGCEGPMGPVGAQGDQGIHGDQGLQGAQGDSGTTGEQGIHGEQGETGAQGTTGARGAQGVQGDTGTTGAIGPEGPQGEPGDNNFGWLAYSGQLSPYGSVSIDLPSEAGTLSNPPVIGVYVSSDPSGPYMPVVDEGVEAYWFLYSLTSHLRISVQTYFPGCYYRVVVIYWKGDAVGKIARGDDQRLREIADAVVW